eukprot:CAMPEP_0171246284 /NCGR_PEP_ID=MMETSP0790-20130122/47863_1 /TAXON_ID=2925 /ORGANISM="Alexandrium catenella, Strain OF101" /LENGTH=211 /DNA_ID=CAMNT_0011713583 /DNA_START=35 /DNA_END=668 /DNA_ORIENTATION=+
MPPPPRSVERRDGNAGAGLYLLQDVSPVDRQAGSPAAPGRAAPEGVDAGVEEDAPEAQPRRIAQGRLNVGAVVDKGQDLRARQARVAVEVTTDLNCPDEGWTMKTVLPQSMRWSMISSASSGSPTTAQTLSPKRPFSDSCKAGLSSSSSCSSCGGALLASAAAAVASRAAGGAGVFGCEALKLPAMAAGRGPPAPWAGGFSAGLAVLEVAC